MILKKCNLNKYKHGPGVKSLILDELDFVLVLMVKYFQYKLIIEENLNVP